MPDDFSPQHRWEYDEDGVAFMPVLDSPSAGIFVDECCFIIHPQWRPILALALDTLTYWNSFTDRASIGEIERAIGRLYAEGCNCMSCCPETNDLLRVSSVGGNLEQGLTDFESGYASYTSASDKVADAAPAFGSLPAGSRDLVLCRALRVWAEGAIKTEQERRTSAAGGLAFAGAFLGAVAAIASFLTGGLAWVAYIGISSAVLGAAAAGWQLVTDAVLGSKQALDDVLCCAYPKIRRRTPTAAVFAAAFDPGGSCDLDIPTDALRQALDAAASEPQAHFAFLKIVQDLSRQNTVGLLGTENECEQCVSESIIQWGGTPQGVTTDERFFNADGWVAEAFDGVLAAYTTSGVGLGAWNGGNTGGMQKRNRIKTGFFNNKYVSRFRLSVTDYSYTTTVQVGDGGSLDNIISRNAASGSQYFDIPVNRVINGDLRLSAFRNSTVGTPPRFLSIIAYIEE